MRQTTYAIFATAMCFVVCACGSQEHGKATSPVPTEPSASQSTPTPAVAPAPAASPWGNLALVGQFDTSHAGELRFDWPNTSIGITFTGTSLAVNLSDDGTAIYSGVPVQSFFDVFVDDQPPHVLSMVAGVSQYPLASQLASGPHTVWLRKRTEAQVGRSIFKGFVLPSNGAVLTPPALRAHRLVVVGASEGSGYGADANVTAANMCHFSADSENADASYPKFLADLLGAELLNLSYSGKGIVRNIVDGDPDTLPVLYQRTVAGDANSPVPTSFNADVVLVNAGGDDLVGPWGQGTLDNAGFQTHYFALLRDIRKREPHAAIFALVGSGPGLNDRITLRTAITAVVQAANRAGDANVTFAELPEYDGHLGFGCDYHPNHATAAFLAQELLTIVRTKVAF